MHTPSSDPIVRLKRELGLQIGCYEDRWEATRYWLSSEGDAGTTLGIEDRFLVSPKGKDLLIQSTSNHIYDSFEY